MKKTLITIMVTLLTAVAALIVFLSVNGCITIERAEETHNKQVYVDGRLTEESNWSDLLGYKIELHFNDGTFIDM